MPLPNNKLFEKFISKTKLVKNKPKKNSVPFNIGSIKGSDAKELHLSYPEMTLTLDSVIKRIESELKSINHQSNYDIALATLGIIAETRHSSTTAIEHANNLFSDFIHESKLHQIVVLKGQITPDYTLEIGKFTLKEFNPDFFLNLAQNCGCGYPDSINLLTGSFSIEHKLFDTNTIYWENHPSIKEMYRNWGQKLWTESVMDIYYQAIAESYKVKWPSIMKQELQILEAGAILHFDINNLMNSVIANHISLFQWDKPFGKGGWALATIRNVLTLNTPPSTLYSECIKWLDNELGFNSLSDEKIDKAIASYSRLLQRAQEHRLKENTNEAFLHFIIALDMIFGIDGQLAVSVSSRTALLVHRQLGNSFKTQTEILKRLYNTRSKYVHEGKNVPVLELKEAENICSQVLWTLLITSGRNETKDIDTLIIKIDYLIAAINSHREIPVDEFKKIGIKDNIQQPPNSTTMDKSP